MKGNGEGNCQNILAWLHKFKSSLTEILGKPPLGLSF